MHKNTYTAKTLIGNWQEERSTEQFEDFNENFNCYLANPSYNKYIPISKDIGNVRDYEKVSIDHFMYVTYCKKPFNDKSSENWMNFQKNFPAGETFKSTF